MTPMTVRTMQEQDWEAQLRGREEEEREGEGMDSLNEFPTSLKAAAFSTLAPRSYTFRPRAGTRRSEAKEGKEAGNVKR